MVEHWQELYEEAIDNTLFWFRRSRLWKQAAKENRAFYQITYGTARSHQLKWHKAQARADSRLELLRRLEWCEYEPYSMCVYPEPKVWKECLICEQWFEHGHADDCELAKVLND